MNLVMRWNRVLVGLLAMFAVVGIISWGCSHTPSEVRTSGGTLHDAAITASVKISLAFAPGVAATGINVDTDGGVVTLKGAVRTEAERQLAVKVAEDAANVRQVVNELTVRG